MYQRKTRQTTADQIEVGDYVLVGDYFRKVTAIEAPSEPGRHMKVTYEHGRSTYLAPDREVSTR